MGRSTKEASTMADELKSEQQNKLAEQEAEYEKNLKSLRRWETAAFCVQTVCIALMSFMVCFGAFEFGRRVEERAEKQRHKTSVVEPAAVEARSLPRTVPDDIYRGYAALVGVQVPGFIRDGGLPPSPR
jgi:hypothetical protein